jgi:hypothetical protein
MARTLVFLALAVAAASPAGARSILTSAPRLPAASAPGHGFPGAFHSGPHRQRHRTDGLLYGFGLDYDDYPAAADGGFFAGGEAVPAPGGVRYLYDRGYPYDYYRPARVREAWREPERQGCATRWEGPVAVHSCRR